MTHIACRAIRNMRHARVMERARGKSVEEYGNNGTWNPAASVKKNKNLKRFSCSYSEMYKI